MEKKWWGLILIIGSIIAAVLLVLMVFFPKETGPYYSDDPRTWVDDKGGGVKEINVDKVTEGEAYIDEMGEQYEKEGIITAFDYKGWYKGNYFKRDYYEGSNKIMSINPKMKPGDGIIEGFVLGRIDDEIPYIYIFLDEDWKNDVENTKVYWGYLFENEEVFDYSNEISEGIYFLKVEDDKERFENNYGMSYGGVYVGDLREDNNSTVIYFY